MISVTTVTHARPTAPAPTMEIVNDREALKAYAEGLEALYSFTKMDPTLNRKEMHRMRAGLLHDGFDPLLTQARTRTREILAVYNKTTQSTEKELVDRQALLYLLTDGKIGRDAWIEPPVTIDYGWNLTLGDRSFMNSSCVALDSAPITIGTHVLMGPNVQLYSATHPINPYLRAKCVENALPIRIHDYVWIGGAAVICPGVTIGEGSTVGAGSVVTKDVPPFTVVAGNPAQVIRVLDREGCRREVDEEYERQAQGRFWEKWTMKTPTSMSLPGSAQDK
ncbi:hypothetical protein DFQ26_009806 [Actinomortierella ambigua]|nr:hypothetical protein DFQ26_009806 [Actinomortierella ambigua]